MAEIAGNKISYTPTGSSTETYGRCALTYDVSALDASSNSVTVSNIQAHFRINGPSGNSVRRDPGLKAYVNGNEIGSWGTYTYSCSGSYKQYTLALGSVTVYNPNQSGAGFSFNISVSCGVKIISTITIATGTSSASTTVNVAGVNRADQLALNKSSVDIGDVLGVTQTYYVSGATHTLTYSFLNTTGTPTITSNQWTIPASFETLMSTVTSASCSLTLTTYVNGSSIGSSTKTFTVTVPTSYVPTITLVDLTLNNTYNSQMIAGYSSFSQTYTLAMSPSGNSATIDSVSASITNNVLVASCTTTATTSDTVPASSTDYSVSLTIIVTDTRGRSVTEVVSVGTVKAFTPPVIAITSLQRCLSDGTPDPAGTYALLESSVSSSYAIVSVVGNVNGTDYALSLVNGVYKGVIGGGYLLATSQYTVTLKVTDQFMSDFSLLPVTASMLLPTMALPLSLYDDGVDMGVTLGKSASGADFHVYMDTVLHGTLTGTYVGDQCTFTLSGTTLTITKL